MTRRPIVLLVDDDENYLLVAQRVLRKAGLPAEVRVARDGREVLDVLGLGDSEVAAAPTRPAVVLLDLNMPVLDGWEVLRRIRQAERTRTLPVVVVSSSGRPDDVRKSYELGANSFVVKRFDPEHPGRYVAETARYWLEWNEAPRAGAA